MSARVAKLVKIDDRRKFDTIYEAEKEANRIREKVNREAEQNGYAVKMLIGISDMDGKTKECKPLHLHFVFYACPGETVAKLIVSCINTFQHKSGLERAATKHNCYSDGYIEYILKQSRKTRYFEHDPDGLLNDINIKEQIGKADCRTFRNMPYENTGKNAKKVNYMGPLTLLYNSDWTPRVGGNDYSPAAGGARVGSPGWGHMKNRKLKSRSTRGKEAREYDDLIPRHEWFSKTSTEKAQYYNSTHMKLSYFAYKMHITTQSIKDDINRGRKYYNKYYYDKVDRKFKTFMKIYLEWRNMLRLDREMREKREMRDKFLHFDDNSDFSHTE